MFRILLKIYPKSNLVYKNLANISLNKVQILNSYLISSFCILKTYEEGFVRILDSERDLFWA